MGKEGGAGWRANPKRERPKCPQTEGIHWMRGGKARGACAGAWACEFTGRGALQARLQMPPTSPLPAGQPTPGCWLHSVPNAGGAALRRLYVQLLAALGASGGAHGGPLGRHPGVGWWRGASLLLPVGAALSRLGRRVAGDLGHNLREVQQWVRRHRRARGAGRRAG